MDRADAEQMVIDAYRLAFDREPDEGGLETYVGRLMAGDHDGFSLLKNLLESDEGVLVRKNAAAFNKRWDRISNDAEDIITNAYKLSLGRLPDEAGMESYTKMLRTRQQDDYGLLRELLQSDESQTRMWGGVNHGPAFVQPQGVSEEIVLLIQELIAARLTERGCEWVLPPIFPSGQVIPPAHVTGLIRTLVMLCETPSISQQAH